MKEDQARVEFWEKLEKELGEKIEAYSLARCHYANGREFPPSWGICYVTRSVFYFRHFAQENWFSAVIRVAGRSVKKDEEFVIGIPLASVASISPLPRQGFLGKLLGTELPPVTIKYETGSGSNEEMRISIDMNREKILSLLNAGKSGTADAGTHPPA